MTHSIDLLYVVSGFAVGFLVGMTGIGGGSLMTPLLILLVRGSSGDCGRDGPALCGGDQKRRHHWFTASTGISIGAGRPARRRQRSDDRR